jgi:cysteine synthase
MPGRIYDSMLALVGDTPLVRLARFDASGPDDEPEKRRAVLWGKCEQLEPAGGV